MFIDTHCHLDATEFDADREQVLSLAVQQNISHLVIPAVARESFPTVIEFCRQHKNCAYALGIHPLYVDQAQLEDLAVLTDFVQQYQPIAIGEIGLDYFVTKANMERQILFFTEQVKIAHQYQLPVLLHVRQAVDDVLKVLRRQVGVTGIAHAFNGSWQQAKQFIDLGFKLGFGGAMTYDRALRIRALAQKLPLDAIVLETDAPDMPPAWLPAQSRNSPLELPKIAQVLADLRQLDVMQVAEITRENALKVLPKLAQLCTSIEDLH